MMRPKSIFYWLYQKGQDYNLFIHEEDDYDDDGDGESKDTAIVIKHQKYTTWLYVLLLACKRNTNFCFSNSFANKLVLEL